MFDRRTKRFEPFIAGLIAIEKSMSEIIIVPTVVAQSPCRRGELREKPSTAPVVMVLPVQTKDIVPVGSDCDFLLATQMRTVKADKVGRDWNERAEWRLAFS